MDTKPCPVCGEEIKAVAIKCRFCNADLTDSAKKVEAEQERELFCGRPALIYDVAQVVPFVVVAALCVGLSLANIELRWVALTFVGLFAILFLRLYVQKWSRKFDITTQRIKVERGFLSKVQESLEIFRVDHFELRKPVGQRLMGGCSLHIFSSDKEFESFYIYGIPNVEALSETLRDCQLRERQRRGLSTFVRA
jgi:hypothetical protein